MLSYLKKFNNIDKSLRDKVSTPEVMKAIDDIEKKYNLNLASEVMKVMTKDVGIIGLENHFSSNFRINKKKALDLAQELKEKVFFDLRDYLGFELEKIVIEKPQKLAPKKIIEKKVYLEN